MGMKKIIFPCILLFVLLSIQSGAQDPLFSQTYANPLYLNPAFAGTGTSQRIGLNYRNEWPGIPGNDVTYNISYDRNFIDSSNGIGFLANVEKSPFVAPYVGTNQAVSTTNISIIYSHQIRIKSFTLSAGVQATYRDKSIDVSKLTYPDIRYPIGGWWDNSEVLLRTNASEPDFSAGVLVYHKNYFAGFSVSHFTEYDESFTDVESFLHTKYIFNAGGMIHIRSVTLTPTVLFENQGTFHQQIAEVYLSVWHITTGVGCGFEEVPLFDYGEYPEANNNISSSMVFTLGYQCKFLNIGYSYYTDLSKLTLATAGTHEASLAFLLPYKSAKRHKVTGINCPPF
jgi:type IX secretion system PorP/SprF family membrane protein